MAEPKWTPAEFRAHYGGNFIRDSTYTKFCRVKTQDFVTCEVDGKPEKRPRPPNSFMVFRACYGKEGYSLPSEWKYCYSQFISHLWRALSNQDRRPAERVAEELKDAHTRIFAGYKYQPGLKAKSLQHETEAEGVDGRSQVSRSSGPQRQTKTTIMARLQATSSPSRRSKRRSTSTNNCWVSTWPLYDPNDQDIQRYPTPTPSPAPSFSSTSSPSSSFFAGSYDYVPSPSVPSPLSSTPSLVFTPTSPTPTSFPVTPTSQSSPSVAGTSASPIPPYATPSFESEAVSPESWDYEGAGAGSPSSGYGYWDNTWLDEMGMQQTMNEDLYQSSSTPSMSFYSNPVPSTSQLGATSPSSSTHPHPIADTFPWDFGLSPLLSQYMNTETFTPTSPDQGYSPQYPDGFLPTTSQEDAFWYDPSTLTSQGSAYDPSSSAVDTGVDASDELEVWLQERIAAGTQIGGGGEDLWGHGFA
ncbi:uncharacterized protein STEHIDRAFT_160407 [Stereum hirsutum FP-91666 SS1]|uniref:uncharacterized protein n=1 Tax=Stereum hirsutum (strain FP-91666) TaxID=721885 RepID=UPI000444A1C1|nr:uncharacterized protein STEHIDRAFT_160407 [Stereum hirsutum FP-91666 SS1]EIM82781.1 hypothetical protein STEHIDRAFT_160407 [Stereum hirsutum FP-91666 SS1]